MPRTRKKCPVLNCPSDSKTSDVRFFRFPVENKEYGNLARIWSQFTRRKNFQPISTESMCEKHFAPDNFVVGSKNFKLSLKHGSVPTIYYENGQQITVSYNQHFQRYVGEQAEAMFEETENSFLVREDEIVQVRYQKLKDLKNSCRFCFTKERDVKFIALSKLQSFSIDPQEMLNLIGVDIQYNGIFSQIICEACFHRIIETENYRKRCRNAQKETILELEELDKKIQYIRKITKVKKPPSQNPEMTWFKVEVDEEEIHPRIVESFDSDDQYADNEDFQSQDGDNDTDDLDSKDPAINFCEISVKKEPEESEDHSQSSNINATPSKVSERTKKRGPKRKAHDSLESSPKIVQHDLTRRSFECFFCRNRFHGYKTYKTHDCQVKQVRCEVVGCTKIFTMQSGYNNHVQRIHGLPKTGKHFCPCCSTCFQMTALKFDEHCAKCVKEKEYKEQPLECDTCKKVFNTLQSFSAHKMFHDTENLPSTVNKDGVPLVPNKKNTEAMCDLCGKTLSNYNSLQKHRHNVHLVNFTGDMFYCDLCPVAKPTRRLLYVHMKSTHIVREHPCEICGKIFRNRELWRKHHLIHNESKRIHLCTLCPHRPGFTFKSALSKHMQQHHGGSHPVRNFVCDVFGCNAAYSLDYLLAKHKSSQHGIMYSNHNHNIPY